jgi:hypothetical protein
MSFQIVGAHLAYSFRFKQVRHLEPRLQIQLDGHQTKRRFQSIVPQDLPTTSDPARRGATIPAPSRRISAIAISRTRERILCDNTIAFVQRVCPTLDARSIWPRGWTLPPRLNLA